MPHLMQLILSGVPSGTEQMYREHIGHRTSTMIVTLAPPAQLAPQGL